MSQITLSSTTDGAQQIANALGVKVDPAPETGKTAGSESGGDSGTPEVKEDQPQPVTDQGGADEDQTQETEGSESDSVEEQEEKPKPNRGKGGFQKRIDKLTAENYRLQQENIRRQQELLEAKQKPVTAPKADELEAEPKIADFQTIDDFLKAHTGWTRKAIAFAETKATKATQSEIERLRSEFSESQKRAEEARIARDFDVRQDAARAIYRDYDEILGETEVIISPQLQRAILNHPLGAHLAYHVAKNPDIAERIGTLGDLDQHIEIGMVLAGLNPQKAAAGQQKAEKADAAPKRKASKAPKPIEQTAGSKAATVKGPDYWANAPYQEYKEARNSGRLK